MVNWKQNKSKSYRLSCSPSASTRTACSFALKLCTTKFQERLLYKTVSGFSAIISNSLFFQKNV